LIDGILVFLFDNNEEEVLCEVGRLKLGEWLADELISSVQQKNIVVHTTICLAKLNLPSRVESLSSVAAFFVQCNGTFDKQPLWYRNLQILHLTPTNVYNLQKLKLICFRI